MTKLTGFLLVLVTLVSCQKETTNELERTDKISTSVIKELMSLRTISARQNSFSQLLSVEERADYMRSRLKSAVSDLKLDDEQTALLVDLERFIKPELYIKGSAIQNEAMRYKPLWMGKANLVFQPQQLGYIFSFTSLDEYQNRVNKVKLSSASRALSEENCDCRTDDPWCNTAAGEYCSQYSQCRLYQDHCGWFLIEWCDGLCTHI